MRKTVIALVVAATVALGAGQATAAGHHHRAPSRSERAWLEQIQDVDPHGGCHLEWDGRWVKATAHHHHHGHWTMAWYEVICAR